MASDRQYDIVVFGATGYTGKLCSEHITTSLPTDLRWAVAGRSESKLNDLVVELRGYHVDRQQPAIEVVQLEKSELHQLAKKTKVLIAAVGPYSTYGEPAVEACASNGTHYLDVTGEVPWVLDMIRKYHELAKANGAIIIPQIGFESCPLDIGTLSLVNINRQKLSTATGDVTFALHDISGELSGGTSATVLSILDSYSIKQLAEAFKNWTLSPVPGPKRSPPSDIFGIRKHPQLGTLGPWVAAETDRAIVQRSWGLIGEGSIYGPNFSFKEYKVVSSVLVGALLKILFTFGLLAVAIPPIRWLLQRIAYAPGTGASKEKTAKEYAEWRGIAVPDMNTSKRAFVRIRYEGSIYYMTGLFLAEGAMTILKNDTLAHKLGGGVLTPATLGQPLIDRLISAGLIYDVKMLDLSEIS